MELSAGMIVLICAVVVLFGYVIYIVWFEAPKKIDNLRQGEYIYTYADYCPGDTLRLNTGGDSWRKYRVLEKTGPHEYRVEIIA